MTNTIQRYKKEFSYSYVSGAYAAIELIRCCPETVKIICIHSSCSHGEELRDLCRKNDIPCQFSDTVFTRTGQKGNVYVLGVFRKFTCALARDRPHIVLVNPSDMGNLGTIIRTMAGLGIHDLAIIEPAADIWNPKTLRASMGSVFHVRHQYFTDFDTYAGCYPDHERYVFVSDGAACPEIDLNGCTISLVFGNEASGLDRKLAYSGKRITIPMSDKIDSFNLAIAVGIGTFMVTKGGLKNNKK